MRFSHDSTRSMTTSLPENDVSESIGWGAAVALVVLFVMAVLTGLMGVFEPGGAR